MFDFFKRDKLDDNLERSFRKNPHLTGKRSAYTSDNVGRFLQGWETQTATIDYYLKHELGVLRARSREMVRQNPYGKRFVTTVKSNVIGPQGVVVQAQTIYNRQPDQAANAALEKAFSDWGNDPRQCDYQGKLSWVDFQNMAVSCAAQDGEFFIRVHRGEGDFGLQLEIIDPELVDTELNKELANGEIRLGIEYDSRNKVVRYHFKKKRQGGNNSQGYDNYKRYSIEADSIIHGFIPEYPDQSRGIPWLHASLERAKHLDKYIEAAIVKARSTAATMAFIKTPPGEDAYQGEDGEWGDYTVDQYEPGSIKDIGQRDVVNVDSSYPHQMYSSFVKAQLQSIASGLGISYHALSADLEGVNYSSIRAGVLEDREIFKGIQNWFIRSLVRQVWEEWVYMAIMRKKISIGGKTLFRPAEEYLPAFFQGRRWAWVDPQKDSAANELAIRMRLKSRTQVIREQGDDPESVFLQCKADEELMEKLGLQEIPPLTNQQPQEAPSDE